MNWIEMVTVCVGIFGVLYIIGALIWTLVIWIKTPYDCRKYNENKRKGKGIRGTIAPPH